MYPKLRDWEGERVPKIDEIWMLACIKNSMQNRWFWRPKFKKNVKKTVPRNMYFSHAFFYRFRRGLGRFLGRFGMGLGVPWRLLGHFKLFVSRLFCQEGPRGSKRRPRGLLGSIPLTPPRGGPPPPPRSCAWICGLDFWGSPDCLLNRARGTLARRQPD